MFPMEASNDEVNCIIFTIQADYCRYVTENVSDKDIYYRFYNKARLLYLKANKITLPHDSISRLRLINNFATFIFEVEKDTSQAINIMEDSINMALGDKV